MAIRRPKDLVLAIDVGTGSVRAALFDLSGRTVAFRAREHDQIVPGFGRAEQRPADWWEGAVASIRDVLDAADGGARRVLAVAACGQMHGTVLIDAEGELALDSVQLWNDKRATAEVRAFAAANDVDALWPLTANPPSVAWPGFKLQWIANHQPKALARAATLLMPKDYINFRLTGRRGMDESDASCTYLFDATTNAWSPLLAERLGVDPALLPPVYNASALIGAVTPEAAAATGLLAGTPVAAGTSDFAATLLGSGVSREHRGSDITGTSTLIAAYAPQPLEDPIVTNMRTADGAWAAFTILDAGGDAMRWARRALHRNEASYDAIVAMAAAAPPGADRLLFLPYLNGERLGGAAGARAEFFGLTSGHDAGHMHRAVMEGVAFAAKRNLAVLERKSGRIESIVAAAGGARGLWLEIKASIYDRPILLPAAAEAGVAGSAMIAALAAGALADWAEARARFVSFADEIHPNPAWRDRYRRYSELFDARYEFESGSVGAFRRAGRGRLDVAARQKSVASGRRRQAFHAACDSRGEGAGGAGAARQRLQSGERFQIRPRRGEIGDEAGHEGVATADRIDDRDGETLHTHTALGGRQQGAACAEGDRRQAPPRPRQLRQALLDIVEPGHQGQLLLADLQKVSLLGRLQGDGAHPRRIAPQRRAQVDVDGDEHARLPRRAHGVALGGG